MNIGILPLAKQKELSGIYRMTVEEIKGLQNIDRHNNYFFVGNSSWLNLDLPCIPMLDNKGGTINLNYLTAANHIDVVHSFFRPFHINNKIKCKKIITISDLTPIVVSYFSNQFLTDYFDGPIRKCAMESDFIVAISEYTKKDIIEVFGIPEEKIKVIYLGLYGEHSILESEEGSMISVTGEDFILTVSDMNPRKNHKGLVDAFCIYKEENPSSTLKLVCAGSANVERVKSILEDHKKYAEDILFTDHVNNKQLNWLYRKSKAVIYPSFFEGFGLPVLEALAFKKAVITSNVTSLPEVGGDAVEYCDPYDIESIANSITRVVENDKYRKSLEDRALGQASKFSYEKAAGELLDLYLV